MPLTPCKALSARHRVALTRRVDWLANRIASKVASKGGRGFEQMELEALCFCIDHFSNLAKTPHVSEEPPVISDIVMDPYAESWEPGLTKGQQHDLR